MKQALSRACFFVIIVAAFVAGSSSRLQIAVAAGAVDASKSSVVVRGVQAPGSQYVSAGNIAPADGKTAIQVMVTLRDAAGNPVSGKAVALRQTAGFPGPVVTNITGPVSNQNGVTTFNITSTKADSPQFMAEDTTDGITLSAQPALVTFTFPGVPSASPSPSVSPGSIPCPSHGIGAAVDEQVGKFFCFAGLNLRVDSVRTVDKADNSLLLTKSLNTQADPDLGYVVVVVTLENRSTSRTQTVPTNWIGFDFADGSKMPVDMYNASYEGAGLNDVPDTLSPGQRIQVTYVVVNWKRSPIRAVYLKRNVGNGQNDPGVQFARFSIP